MLPSLTQCIDLMSVCVSVSERYTAPEMCVCVWCVSYFSEGANDGALNDASEEDEVDVLGPWS